MANSALIKELKKINFLTVKQGKNSIFLQGKKQTNVTPLISVDQFKEKYLVIFTDNFNFNRELEFFSIEQVLEYIEAKKAYFI